MIGSSGNSGTGYLVRVYSEHRVPVKSTYRADEQSAREEALSLLIKIPRNHYVRVINLSTGKQLLSTGICQ